MKEGKIMEDLVKQSYWAGEIIKDYVAPYCRVQCTVGCPTQLHCGNKRTLACEQEKGRGGV